MTINSTTPCNCKETWYRTSIFDLSLIKSLHIVQLGLLVIMKWNVCAQSKLGLVSSTPTYSISTFVVEASIVCAKPWQHQTGEGRGALREMAPQRDDGESASYLQHNAMTWKIPLISLLSVYSSFRVYLPTSQAAFIYMSLVTRARTRPLRW